MATYGVVYQGKGSINQIEDVVFEPKAFDEHIQELNDYKLCKFEEADDPDAEILVIHDWNLPEIIDFIKNKIAILVVSNSSDNHTNMEELGRNALKTQLIFALAYPPLCLNIFNHLLLLHKKPIIKSIKFINLNG